MLAYRFKKISFLLIPFGILLLVLYLKGIKPDFLDIPVFAFASTYFENHFFALVRTNAIDEIGFLILISGIYMLIFTEEKTEKPAYQALRQKALFFSLKVTFLLFTIAYIFFFGYIIFPISGLMFLIFITIYYAYFKFLIFH
jgi:hypothetical protein